MQLCGYISRPYWFPNKPTQSFVGRSPSSSIPSLSLSLLSLSCFSLSLSLSLCVHLDMFSNHCDSSLTQPSSSACCVLPNRLLHLITCILILHYLHHHTVSDPLLSSPSLLHSPSVLVSISLLIVTIVSIDSNVTTVKSLTQYHTERN